jgi:hypothetical protein
MNNATAIGPKHLDRCQREATRDVVFLFQRRMLRWTGRVPDGYYIAGEHLVESGSLEISTLRDLHNAHGSEYVHETWHVEGVWLDREEAEAFGKLRSYNYPDGWRVYGVCAEGELAAVLRRVEFMGASPQ